jgi:hypothetical protein
MLYLNGELPTSIDADDADAERVCDLLPKRVSLAEVDYIFNYCRANKATQRHLRTLDQEGRHFDGVGPLAAAVKDIEDAERAERKKVLAYLLHPQHAQLLAGNGPAVDVDMAFVCKVFNEAGTGMDTLGVVVGGTRALVTFIVLSFVFLLM